MKTNKAYIQELLDRYMAAETTEDEEQLLSAYFCTHKDIPDEWQGASVLFRGLRRGKPQVEARHRTMILRWSAAAAAVVVLALGVGWLFQEDSDSHHALPDSPPALPYREGAVTFEGRHLSSSLIHSAPSLSGRAGGESSGGESSVLPAPAKITVKPARAIATSQPKKEKATAAPVTAPQEDICIDCELQTMEEKMLAMVSDFENM